MNKVKKPSVLVERLWQCLDFVENHVASFEQIVCRDVSLLCSTVIAKPPNELARLVARWIKGTQAEEIACLLGISAYLRDDGSGKYCSYELRCDVLDEGKLKVLRQAPRKINLQQLSNAIHQELRDVGHCEILIT